MWAKVIFVSKDSKFSILVSSDGEKFFLPLNRTKVAGAAKGDFVQFAPVQFPFSNKREGLTKAGEPKETLRVAVDAEIIARCCTKPRPNAVAWKAASEQAVDEASCHQAMEGAGETLKGHAEADHI